MSFGTVLSTISREDISHIPQSVLLSHYLGIEKIPCVINSPLRRDEKPSFSLYTKDGSNIQYKDFSTNEGGNIYHLLKELWNCTYRDVYAKIHSDLYSSSTSTIPISLLKSHQKKSLRISTSNDISIIPREWRDYDIEYWKEYGIHLEALKYAEVIPISYIYIIREGKKTVYRSEKLAYAFAEHKEGKTTYKIYQPLSKSFKWTNKHDGSVISLWTKIPKSGREVIICSSLKDALCVWCNTNIPCLSLQGEGYSISETALSNLRKRYETIYILFDNDDAGIKYGKSLSEATGFIYLELPKINNQKDASDIYKSLTDKSKFLSIILSIIHHGKKCNSESAGNRCS